MILFDKTYTSESIIDMDQDVMEFFLDDIYDNFDIPQDENGFMRGSFRVKIDWTPDE